MEFYDFESPLEVLEELEMSIATWQGELSNLKMDYKDLQNQVFGKIDRKIVVGHHSNHNHEDPLKLRTKTPKPRKKGRKVHGDGTSFQACLEIWITIDHPEINAKFPDKVYKIKCFSSTGKIQIPGGRLESGEDCRIAIQNLIKFFNSLDIGKDAEGNTVPIELVRLEPSMMNFKTKLKLDDPTLDLYNYKLNRYIQAIQEKDLEGIEGTYIEPPYGIINTVNVDESPRTAFKCNTSTSSFRVEIFNNMQKSNIGKINIKGTKSRAEADAAYDYIRKIFIENWSIFIGPRPKMDPPVTRRREKKKQSKEVDDILRTVRQMPMRAQDELSSLNALSSLTIK